MYSCVVILTAHNFSICNSVLQRIFLNDVTSHTQNRPVTNIQNTFERVRSTFGFIAGPGQGCHVILAKQFDNAVEGGSTLKTSFEHERPR